MTPVLKAAENNPHFLPYVKGKVIPLQAFGVSGRLRLQNF
jgi:hypothetical protein